MSVTAGRFLDKNTRLFASGAPRAKLHGAVYFLHKNNNGSVMDIPLIINGEQFGSSFGYEILSEDINQDGYDDLVVGAPFFFNNTEGKLMIRGGKKFLKRFLIRGSRLHLLQSP